MSSTDHASPFDPWLSGDPQVLGLLGDEELLRRIERLERRELPR